MFQIALCVLAMAAGAMGAMGPNTNTAVWSRIGDFEYWSTSARVNFETAGNFKAIDFLAIRLYISSLLFLPCVFVSVYSFDYIISSEYYGRFSRMPSLVQ